MIALATHPSERGGGRSVSRYWKQGAVDYKQDPELAVLISSPIAAPAARKSGSRC